MPDMIRHAGKAQDRHKSSGGWQKQAVRMGPVAFVWPWLEQLSLRGVCGHTLKWCVEETRVSCAHGMCDEMTRKMQGSPVARRPLVE